MRFNKKLAIMLLVFSIIINTFIAWANNDSSVRIQMDGQNIIFPDAQPFIDENDRTQVPIASVSEVLGAINEWNNESQTATFTLNNVVISMTVGDSKIIVNNNSVKMDTTIVLRDGRVYAPLKYIAKAFNFDTVWNEETNTVAINKSTNDGTNIQHTDYGFEFNLLKELPQDENFMISPFSVKMAMAMAANGAEDKTKKEILEVLGIEDINQYNEKVSALINSYADLSQPNISLSIANSIWLNTDYYKDLNPLVSFSNEFKQIIKNYYQGNAGEVNNNNGAKTINNWIANKTNNKITTALRDEDVKKLLSFLVNTIYFKGNWADPFDKMFTKQGEFTDVLGNKKTVDFMSKTSYFTYFEDEHNKVLELPYEGRKIKMDIILPNANLDMQDVQNTLINFDDTIKAPNYEHSYVDIKIPKFKMEYNIKLSDTLSKMGMNLAFDNTNDGFNAMYKNMPLPSCIKQVFHSTYIEVNEDGTEAAAATVVGGAGGSSNQMPEPKKFYADHPFIYLIRDAQTQDILFIGKYH